MKTLLQIRTSIFSDGGQSSRLAERFVAAWRESNPDGQVIVRDLALEPVPHLDAARFGAFLAKPGEYSAAQQAVASGARRQRVVFMILTPSVSPGRGRRSR